MQTEDDRLDHMQQQVETLNLLMDRLSVLSPENSSSIIMVRNELMNLQQAITSCKTALKELNQMKDMLEKANAATTTEVDYFADDESDDKSTIDEVFIDLIPYDLLNSPIFKSFLSSDIAALVFEQINSLHPVKDRQDVLELLLSLERTDEILKIYDAYYYDDNNGGFLSNLFSQYRIELARLNAESSRANTTSTTAMISFAVDNTSRSSNSLISDEEESVNFEYEKTSYTS